MPHKFIKFLTVEKIAESLAIKISDYFDQNRVLYPDVECPSKEEIRDYLLKTDPDIEDPEAYLMKTAEDFKQRIKKDKKLLLE